jgi:hypothetical protein
VAGCKESPPGPCRPAWKADGTHRQLHFAEPRRSDLPAGRRSMRRPNSLSRLRGRVGRVGRGSRRRHAFRPFEKPRHFPFPTRPCNRKKARSPSRIDAERRSRDLAISVDFYFAWGCSSENRSREKIPRVGEVAQAAQGSRKGPFLGAGAASPALPSPARRREPRASPPRPRCWACPASPLPSEPSS